MPVDPRVLDLVQEVLDSNRTPEEVCAECPELIPAVKIEWSRVRRVDSELAAIFPASDYPAGLSSRGPRVLRADDKLPIVPGYEVEAVLGRGGMGIVYKACHLKLNRPVALKMMLYGAYATPLEVARFQREAEAVAKLQHPNIVQIYDVGEADGKPYHTMEFAEGGNLAQKLAGQPQRASVAATITATLADAMEEAHKSGIVHRDLKPTNILLTSNGVLKISDFGLARQFNGDLTPSLSAARVGTPSYMAPEQALGKPSAFAPSVDIYALGAILYEMLTGRPPFRAETTAETQRQVISEDPAPPSRLNSNVPRDLETICLKCLHKEPQRRYGSAALLAEDLRHFQRGEPINARRPSPLERSAKWIARHPSLAGLIAVSAISLAIVSGGATWISRQHAQRQRAIEVDLQELEHLERQANWTEAEVVAQRAEARLGGSIDAELRNRLDQARRDLDLVIELDRIRMKRFTSGNLPYYKTKADGEYLKSFAESGLAQPQDTPQAVARRIESSSVQAALISALDDWAVCAANSQRRGWLLDIAQRVDSDPEGWTAQIRDSKTWDDLPTLEELTTTVPVGRFSVSLLLALGQRFDAAGGDATSFLKRVQKEYPADFCANMVLGDVLYMDSPSESLGYYRAALASRPQAAVAYTAVGDALRREKNIEEATDFYRKAIEIDPNYARGINNLANIIKDSGQIDEAIKLYEKVLKIDPNYSWAHLDLGNALIEVGRLDESVAHLKIFHEIDSTIPAVENILRSDRIRHGEGEKVLQEWKQSLAVAPPRHDPWFGYAELCLFLEKFDEYELARESLISQFGDTQDPYVCERTARAILLAPPSKEQLRTAVLLADRAIDAESEVPDWVFPYVLFAKGLAEYQEGHFENALKILEGKGGSVLGPCPHLVSAMATFKLGDEKLARQLLADQIANFDWSQDAVRSHDQWLWHILRRQAEKVILPQPQMQAASSE